MVVHSLFLIDNIFGNIGGAWFDLDKSYVIFPQSWTISSVIYFIKIDSNEGCINIATFIAFSNHGKPIKVNEKSWRIFRTCVLISISPFKTKLQKLLYLIMMCFIQGRVFGSTTSAIDPWLYAWTPTGFSKNTSQHFQGVSLKVEYELDLMHKTDERKDISHGLQKSNIFCLHITECNFCL